MTVHTPGDPSEEGELLGIGKGVKNILRMEKVLTTEQRIKVYKALLNEMEDFVDVEKGLCLYLSALLDDDETLPSWWRGLIGGDKIEYLPELTKYNPVPPHPVYWTSRDLYGFNKRLRWVKQAIKEIESTNPLLNS